MTRRQILAVAAAAPTVFNARPARANGAPLKNMGMAPTAVALRSRADRQSFDMVEHATISDWDPRRLACHRMILRRRRNSGKRRKATICAQFSARRCLRWRVK